MEGRFYRRLRGSTARVKSATPREIGTAVTVRKRLGGYVFHIFFIIC